MSIGDLIFFRLCWRFLWYTLGMDKPPPYVSVAQAAELLGISARAVRDRIDRGELHAHLLNARLLLIPRAEVERQQPGPHKRGRKPGQKRSSRARNAPKESSK